ncbi:MAG: protein kinase [Acidobacteriota bacterium]
MHSTNLPETIGPYRFETLLGSGGMGRVFLAYDARLDRRVAIKHIQPDQADHVEARERLRREARASAALAHPAIVQVFDLLTTAEGDWVVMEYVDGPTLADWLDRDSRPLHRILEIALDVIRGLRYAHDQGIVHRDLKTENVMLSSLGQAKILDFGLAKRLGDHAELELTTDGEVLGTLRSMSPEQAQGGEITPASDLFSFGILLYECLAGTSPFAGRSHIDALVRLCTEPHTPLSEHVEGVADGLRDLTDQLLAKDPAQRPNGEAVELALQAVLESVSPDDKIDRAREDAEHTPRPMMAPTVAMPAPKLDVGRWLILATLVLVAFGIAWWWGGSAVDDPIEGREAYTRASELLATGYREGHAEQAEALLGQHLESYPNHAPSHVAMARALMWQFSRTDDRLLLDRAFDEVSLAVELDPYLVSARAELAVMHRTRGDDSAARAELDRALELDPESAVAWRELGSLRCYLEGADAAREAFGHASRLAPDDWLLFERIGLCFYSSNALDDADSAFRRVTELAPDYALTYSNLMAIDYARGDFDGAAEWLGRSLEIESSASAYANLGALEFLNGRYRKALDAFEQAVALGARSYLNWANMADALRWLPGRRHESDDLYRRAVQLAEAELQAAPSQQVPVLESRVANYRVKLGDSTGAAALIPDDPSVFADDMQSLYRTAQTLELLDRREDALEFLAEAFAQGYPVALVERDPELTDLRGDPAYQRLQIGLDG